MKDLEQQLPSDAKPEKPQCAPHRTRENIFSAEDEGLRAAEDERKNRSGFAPCLPKALAIVFWRF